MSIRFKDGVDYRAKDELTAFSFIETWASKDDPEILRLAKENDGQIRRM